MINFAAFVATTHVFTVASAREIAPVLPFAAALAGQELGPYLGTPGCQRPTARPGRDRGARPGAGRVPGRAWPRADRPGRAAAGRAADGVAGEPPIGAGLAGYWEANVVTLASGGRVAVRPVTIADGRVAPTGGEVRAEWFNPGLSVVDFVVLFPGVSGYPGFSDQQAVLATFGKPGRVYRVGLYTILWWPKNLLADIAWVTRGPPGALPRRAALRGGPGARRWALAAGRWALGAGRWARGARRCALRAARCALRAARCALRAARWAVLAAILLGLPAGCFFLYSRTLSPPPRKQFDPMRYTNASD